MNLKDMLGVWGCCRSRNQGGAVSGLRKKQQKRGEVGGFERWLEGRLIVLGC